MMTKSLVAVAIVATAVSSAVAGAGQEKIPYLQKQPPPDATSTLSGCVARGAVTGTHTLTNITKDGGVAAKDTLQGRAVVLAGSDVDLSRHVGHRVSVTGSYVSDAPAMVPIVAKAPPDARESEMKTTGTLTVKSLIVLADSCSKAANLVP